MAEKLTARTELTGESVATDFLHVVRGSASYKAQVSFLFDNAEKVHRYTLGNIEMLVFRKDPTDGTGAVLQAGDIAIYINTTASAETMIIGIAIDVVSTYPSHLLDATKFMRFIDNSPLI